MGEPLFEQAYADMLAKAMRPEDFEAMVSLYDERYPSLPQDPNKFIHTWYAGMGGADLGFEQAGFSPGSSIDGWDLANKVREENNIGGDVIQAFIGTNQGEYHPDDIVDFYANGWSNQDLFLHGSPPCQAYTNAVRTGGKSGLTPEQREQARLDAFPFIGNFLYAVEQLHKHSDVNLIGWSMENAKEVAPYIMENDHLLDQYVSPEFKKEIMQKLMSQPILDSVNFGTPTTRKRTFLMEGADPIPTHYKYGTKPIEGRQEGPTIGSTLPHLLAEDIANRPAKREKIDSMLAVGNISPEVAEYLYNNPLISQSGSINPGITRGKQKPASWMNLNARHPSQEGGPSTAFFHRKPLDATTTGITHNMPSLMYARQLELPEVMMQQGIDPRIDLSSAEGKFYRKTNPFTGNVKSIKAPHQMLGNVVTPPVTRAIGLSALGRDTPKAQRSLLDFN